MISVIIPTLNEEDYLEKTISHILQQKGNYDYEIIVVDGGGEDRTVEIAKQYTNIIIIHSNTRQRAYQMNLGASKAKGDILLFLHADTILPEDAFEEIENILQDKEIVAGGFKGKFKSEKGNKVIYIEFYYLISRIFNIILGDQALFVRKDVFNKVNGYPNIEIMEEFSSSRKLRKYGKLTLSNEVVPPSYRRFKQGFVKTNLIFLLITLLYYLKVNPKKTLW